MGELFNRRATLTVGPSGGTGKSWTAFDLAFSVVKTGTSEPNTCKVSIWNISPDDREFVQGKGLTLILSAGYVDSEELLFKGDVDRVENEYGDVDWRTDIYCGDGQTSFRTARIAKSFQPGTPQKTVLQELLSATGLPAGVIKGLEGLTEKVSGTALFGQVARLLPTYTQSVGLEWSIQDGANQLIPSGTDTGEQAVLLTPTTGLIGSPKKTREKGSGGQEIPGLQIVSLLQPSIRPGRRVKVESSTFTGVYRVRKVEHNGDLAGQAWYTQIDCRE